jgi:hypothetical protein
MNGAEQRRPLTLAARNEAGRDINVARVSGANRATVVEAAE